MSFADVASSIGGVDGTAAAAPKGAFSDVLTAIDSGGNSTAREQSSSKVARNIGTGEAFGRGVAQGVTANFYDELRGLHEAGGASADEPMSLGSVLKGAFRRMTGDKEAVAKYEAVTSREREANKQAEEQHPVASTVGNVAGATVLPIGSAARGATLAARAGRAAIVGAGYGAAAGAGEGENPIDRATRATTGGILGGVVGGAATPVVEGVVGAGGRLLSPLTSRIRGAWNPEDEAARRVMGSIKSDREIDPAATARLTGQEYQEAVQNGTPAMAMDLGGERTRALARSAANTSPEARFLLNEQINKRFESQGPRLYDWMNRSFNFPSAEAQQTAIEATSKGVNRSNYRAAYQQGDRELFSPEMERLVGSPAVADAMRRAATSGKDRAVTEGLGAFNPGVTVENGVVQFRKGQNGVPTYPNLQFWDATKRELDDAATSAARAGRNGEADVLGNLSKSLRGELDKLVPSYATARAGAAHFFGAENALEAGQKFVGSGMSNETGRQLLGKMSPTERQLFQDGFVSQYLDKISRSHDRRSILNNIAESPQARERLKIALGPQKSDELEAHLRVEGIMDEARKAVQGNSKTAQFWAELGLAGGGLGASAYAAYQTGDPKQLAYGALAAAIAGGTHHIDSRLAQNVAQMLVSKDPTTIRRGMQVLVKDKRMLDGLRSFDKRIAAIGGEQSPNGLIAAGMTGRADENEPGGNGVRH